MSSAAHNQNPEEWLRGRRLHSKLGVIRGDTADKWLLENDPDYFREKKRKPRQLSLDSGTWEFEDVTPREHERDYWLDSAEASCVYFMQGVVGGPVKIGYSRGSLRFRLREVQCGSPVELVYRRVVKGDHILERDLHDHFDHLRLRGEWFRVDGELARIAHALI